MLGLNRKAVLSMQEGSYLSAYSLFSSALERLRTEVDARSTARDPAASGTTAEAALEAVPVGYAATADAVTNNAFAFYASAFVFAGTEAELAAAGRNELRLATVVLYNFGLYFHVHGLGRPAAQGTHFAKALRMYQTALGLLEAAAELRPAGAAAAAAAEDRDCLLRLALHNNMGHIYSCDHRDAETQDCLESLRRILARQADRARRGDAADDAVAVALRGLEYLDFHLNVVILHGARNFPPAA